MKNHPLNLIHEGVKQSLTMILQNALSVAIKTWENQQAGKTEEVDEEFTKDILAGAMLGACELENENIVVQLIVRRADLSPDQLAVKAAKQEQVEKIETENVALNDEQIESTAVAA